MSHASRRCSNGMKIHKCYLLVVEESENGPGVFALNLSVLGHSLQSHATNMV